MGCEDYGGHQRFDNEVEGRVGCEDYGDNDGLIMKYGGWDVMSLL